ncbi:MAG: hypothetical protein LBT58_00365 [Endomicrobium sp.]|nr:hypothetical protein [Endomicrobium sp.]
MDLQCFLTLCFLSLYKKAVIVEKEEEIRDLDLIMEEAMERKKFEYGNRQECGDKV